jgi:uncharacterized protein YjiS (DUF1127 family)
MLEESSTMTSPIPGLRLRMASAPSLPLRAVARVALERLFVWLTLARSRRDLAQLDDRALRDIGIDRATAIEESSKPFWRLH